MVGEWLVGQWIVRVRKYLVCKTSYSGGKEGYQDFTQTEYEVCTYLPCINVYLAKFCTLYDFECCIVSFLA